MSKTIAFRVPDGMADEFRDRAELEGKTFTDIMSDLLAAYLRTPVNSLLTIEPSNVVNVCQTPVNNDAIDSIHKELAELSSQVTANTARMDRDDNTFLKDVMETLRDDKDYRKLPEQFERQDERIDLWVESLKKHDGVLRELSSEWARMKAEQETFHLAHSEMVQMLNLAHDRLYGLENGKPMSIAKVSEGVSSVKVGTGFGKH